MTKRTPNQQALDRLVFKIIPVHDGYLVVDKYGDTLGLFANNDQARSKVRYLIWKAMQSTGCADEERETHYL